MPVNLTIWRLALKKSFNRDDAIHHSQRSDILQMATNGERCICPKAIYGNWEANASDFKPCCAPQRQMIGGFGLGAESGLGISTQRLQALARWATLFRASGPL
jgi:hypothetical protein